MKEIGERPLTPSERRLCWLPVMGADGLLGFYRVVTAALDSDFLNVYNCGPGRTPIQIELYKTTFLLGVHAVDSDRYEIAVDSHSHELSFWREVKGFVETVRT